MAIKKDNQMTRSTSQALYKYIPGKWIDFYFSTSRKGYTAFVDRWSSIPLENINKKRLLRQVSLAVDSYRKQNAQFDGGEFSSVKDFGSTIDETTYSVLTPRVSDLDRAIIGSISPKVFFCEKCGTVHRFKRDSHYSYIIKQKCKYCSNNLVQLRDIYYCQCGWAGEVTIGNCDNHKDAPVKINVREHSYKCTVCNKSTAIFRKCPECGKKIIPKNVLDSAQCFVKSLSVIDLLDSKMDDFLSDEEEGAIIITANYLGLIGDEEFKKAVKYGRRNKKEMVSELVEKHIDDLVAKGMPREYAEMAAKAICQSEENDSIENAITEAKALLVGETGINHFAEIILEYNTVKKECEIVTLDYAIEMAKKLNTHSNPDMFHEYASKKGFSSIQACDRIPFIQCSYGFTREFVDSSHAAGDNKIVVLKAFPNESAEKKNVYATKLMTEGVLFEINKAKILEWLLRNKVISESDMPVNMNNEQEVKAWFINKIKIESIQPFSILSEDDTITHYVYRLIHTISHVLIKAAAEVCGLDQNSLSEYIFSNVPAIFIYCQNSQGFNMGALFSIFEMYFDKWLDRALEIATECIFDPVCSENEGACTGCIYTNEVSCQHFNYDLDRTLLIGKYDKKNSKRFYGFWEE